jgi:polyhydroxyalkanoate synthesis regulator phasin
MKGTQRRRRAQPQADAAQGVRDSAQKIWLAGLGAFERAKTEGPRVFESLVEQGRNMGARAVGMADEALKNMRQANYQQRFSKSFEQVASGKEVEALSRQVRDLADSMRRFVTGSGDASKPKPKATGRKRRATASGTRSRKKASGAGSSTRKKAAAKRTRRASRAPRPQT